MPTFSFGLTAYAAGGEEAAAWLRDNGGDCQIVLLDWETCGLQAARDLRESFLLNAQFQVDPEEGAPVHLAEHLNGASHQLSP